MSADVELTWTIQADILELARQQAAAKGMTFAQYLTDIVTMTVTGREAQTQRAHEMWEQSRAVA